VTPETDLACPVCGTEPASVPSGIPYRSADFLHCGPCDHYWISGASRPVRDIVAVQLEHFGAEFAQREDRFQNLYQGMNARRALGICAPARGAKVLEVGPGGGYLMAALAQRGCEVVGLDLSQDVVDAVRARFGLTILRETIGACAERAGDGRFDLAMMCHVVEHFSDPLAEIGQIRRLLKRGGRAYVAVPNMGSWHARLRGWNGYQPYHLHYFTASSLLRLFERAGFEIERERTWEGLTAWSNTLHRGLARVGVDALDSAAAKKMRSPRAGRQALEIARLCVGIATTPLRWIQAGLGAGEELILVARKA